MKDPCEDNCIVKVNCTQVCDEKKNYLTLLKDAKMKFRGKSFNREYHGQYRYYDRKHLRCNIDISNITSRGRKIGRE